MVDAILVVGVPTIVEAKGVEVGRRRLLTRGGVGGYELQLAWTVISTKLKRNTQVATIDSSIPSSDPAPPRASGEYQPPQSSSRPNSRRSDFNRQIYQFALGYPQTPPDTTPDIDPIGPSLQGDPSGAQSNMGSFLFQWAHPASEVYVTGTFDDWGKTVKLDKKGNVHEKLVELPSATEKIYYKFVVDGNWITDHTAPEENDGHHNYNNVLLPEHIQRSQSSKSNMSDLPGSFPETPGNEPAEFAINSGAGKPGYGDSGNTSSKQARSGPEIPASNKTASTRPDDKASGRSREDSQQAFGVSPLPATSGLGNPIHLRPGEKVPDPSTFTRNTVNSTATTDEQSYLNSTGAPMLPDVVTPEKEREARGGMFGLPIMSKNMIPESSLPMGDGTARERDPGMTIQSASPNSTTAGLAANVPREPRGVPEVVQHSQAEAGVEPEASANAEAVKEKRAVEHELETRIPEKPAVTEGETTSTGIEGVPDIVRDSQAKAGYSPEASANPEAVREKRALEGELEHKVPEQPAITAGVPEVVRDSQAKAAASPEASANPEAVREKRALEEELERKVPEEPATVDETRGAESAMQNENMRGVETAGLAVGGLGAAAGLTGALAHEPSATRSEQPSGLSPHGLPPSVLQSIEEMNKGSAITPAVSDFDQGYAKEGSAPASAVPAFGQQEKLEGTAIAPIVPDAVQESIAEAHQSPEAAANPVAVQEKAMVEDELRQKVRTEEAFGEPAPSVSPALAQTAPAPTGISSATPAAVPAATQPASSRVEGLAAPASAQASTPVTKAAETQAVESRDVSPMSKSPTTTQTQPMVTSGVAQSAAPPVSQGQSSSPATAAPSKPSAKVETPSKPTPSSSKAADSPASGTTSDKKKKRSSFFGKLKEKFSDKK